MFVPFQSASRRRGRSLRLAISLTIALGLARLFNQAPPLQPMGVNPSEGGRPKKCPNPDCGRAVRPDRRGRYVCLACGLKFTAAEAEDYA
jgi:uncharacterized protein (DUF983 family)